MKRGRKVRPVYDRVMSMTNIPKNDKGKPDNKACWEFQGAKNNAGYGMIRKENVKTEYWFTLIMYLGTLLGIIICG